METTMNVTEKSLITINDISFGDTTMYITEFCLHLYNRKGRVGMIALGDIKSFYSNNPEIDYKVNQFLSELE